MPSLALTQRRSRHSQYRVDRTAVRQQSPTECVDEHVRQRAALAHDDFPERRQRPATFSDLLARAPGLHRRFLSRYPKIEIEETTRDVRPEHSEDDESD